MSARLPTRRIGRPALNALRPSSTYWVSTPLTSHRYASNAPKRNREPPPETALAPAAEPEKKPFLQRLNPFASKTKDMSNVTLAKYLQKREADKKSGRQIERPETRPGSLSEQTSLFKPDVEIQGFRDELSAEEREQLLKRDREARETLHRRYSDRLAASKLDPDPSGRKRLERKLVIRSIRRRGRLTKDQTLARTERQLLWQSQMLPTSVKKLTRLMHMIQGKTIEEAMVQLRFSAKKVAVDVIKGLQIARDEAIAGRGMGLGFTLPSPQPTSTTTIAEETDAALDESAETEVAEEEGNKKSKGPRVSKREQEELLLLDGTRIRPKIGEPKTIELRNGKHMKVYDPTALYIDQAWVGRGSQTQEPEFRARGKVNLLYHRTTSFSVLLKEEKTRMRISDEIQKKRANRKVWMPMPDRPVLEQRQYCLW